MKISDTYTEVIKTNKTSLELQWSRLKKLISSSTNQNVAKIWRGISTTAHIRNETTENVKSV
jgi:hypothetical protein